MTNDYQYTQTLSEPEGLCPPYPHGGKPVKKDMLAYLNWRLHKLAQYHRNALAGKKELPSNFLVNEPSLSMHFIKKKGYHKSSIWNKIYWVDAKIGFFLNDALVDIYKTTQQLEQENPSLKAQILQLKQEIKDKHEAPVIHEFSLTQPRMSRVIMKEKDIVDRPEPKMTKKNILFKPRERMPEQSNVVTPPLPLQKSIKVSRTIEPVEEEKKDLNNVDDMNNKNNNEPKSKNQSFPIFTSLANEVLYALSQLFLFIFRFVFYPIFSLLRYMTTAVVSHFNVSLTPKTPIMAPTNQKESQTETDAETFNKAVSLDLPVYPSSVSRTIKTFDLNQAFQDSPPLSAVSIENLNSTSPTPPISPTPPSSDLKDSPPSSPTSPLYIRTTRTEFLDSPDISEHKKEVRFSLPELDQSKDVTDTKLNETSPSSNPFLITTLPFRPNTKLEIKETNKTNPSESTNNPSMNATAKTGVVTVPRTRQNYVL